jgi:hypothetical protein
LRNAFAARKTNRRARLIELDPIYVDRAIRRWQEYSKDEAILMSSQQSFDGLAQNVLKNGTRSVLVRPDIKKVDAEG